MSGSAFVTDGIGGLAILVAILFTFATTRIGQPKVALRFLAWMAIAGGLASGGYLARFDHMPPPQVDAYGLRVRVPLWAISPHVKRGVVTSRKPADHVSTLKFIERLWGLPTLASRNHTFDKSTPTG